MSKPKRESTHKVRFAEKKKLSFRLSGSRSNVHTNTKNENGRDNHHMDHKKKNYKQRYYVIIRLTVALEVRSRSRSLSTLYRHR